MSWNSYRWREDRDDVVIVMENAAGDVIGIETKVTATVRSDHFRGVRKLRDHAGDRFKGGYVVCTAAQTLPFGERLWAVPVKSLRAG